MELFASTFLSQYLTVKDYDKKFYNIRHKHKLLRKLISAASLIPACCLIGVCLSGCDKNSAVACMIIAAVVYGSMYSGVYSNHVDLAPNYAGHYFTKFLMCFLRPIDTIKFHFCSTLLAHCGANFGHA